MDDGKFYIDTIYGRFTRSAKKRLDLTYDYEHAGITGFKEIAQLIGASRFFDIGANIGVYSVYLSSVPSISAIHSFEPSPESFAVLNENIGLQQNPGLYHTHQLALSSSAGHARFAMFGAMAGNNAIMASMQQSKTPSEVVEVEAARLDSLFDSSNETFAAKIDVEGHELDVLSGAEAYLKSNTGILQIESFSTKALLIREAMSDLGYQQIFRMKEDYYFTNIADANLGERIVDVLFEENAKALHQAQQLKRQRRKAIREARAVFDTVKFGSDPIVIRQVKPGATWINE